MDAPGQVLPFPAFWLSITGLSSEGQTPLPTRSQSLRVGLGVSGRPPALPPSTVFEASSQRLSGWGLGG